MSAQLNAVIIVRGINSFAGDLYGTCTDPASMRRWMAILIDGWSHPPVTAEEQKEMREGFRIWLDQLEVTLR